MSVEYVIKSITPTGVDGENIEHQVTEKLKSLKDAEEKLEALEKLNAEKGAHGKTAYIISKVEVDHNAGFLGTEEFKTR